MGTLYLVGTPIGNLEDITLRALRILEQVTLIAAEDTRRARILTRRYEIETPITSYFEGNKLTKLETVLGALDVGDVALISEAGMPGLSDPGYELVRAAIERDLPVVPIPGPSAPVTALVVSGLPSDSFLYLGFLSRRRSERCRLLAAVVQEWRTLVFFEAPHRLRASLADIEAVLGNRPLAICRELTKLHEEVWRGTVSDARVHFDQVKPRASSRWSSVELQRNAGLGKRTRYALRWKNYWCKVHLVLSLRDALLLPPVGYAQKSTRSVSGMSKIEYGVGANQRHPRERRISPGCLTESVRVQICGRVRTVTSVWASGTGSKGIGRSDRKRRRGSSALAILSTLLFRLA